MDEAPTWSLRDALTAFALVIVASGLATGLLVVGTGQDVGDGEQGGIILGVVGTAIGMISGLAYARTKAPASAFSLRPCSLEWAVYGIALVAPVLGFGYGWASFLEWLGVGTQPQTYVDAMLRSSDLTTLVISGLYGVLGAAIFEELLFRGIIQPPLVARWGLGLGIAAQGLIFGMMHMVDLWAVFPTAVIGCVAGWLRFKSGGLGAPILFHATNNLLALLFNATMT